MDDQQVGARCRTCGRTPADHTLNGEGPLCDRCADDRIAAATGMPRLPDAPPPVVIVGEDGRRHLMRYRFWRAPTGISVQLREDDVRPGFEFGVLGDHDADIQRLVDAVRAEAEREISRGYLTPEPDRSGWLMAGEEVAGRLVWDPDGGPVCVVVDGRTLSWQELGEILASCEGWRFRLLIDDPSVDLRSGATNPERLAGDER